MHTPGWIVLSRKAAEIAGLLIISRLLDPPVHTQAQAQAGPAPLNGAAPPMLPEFIAEVVDQTARRYRGKTPGGWLFAAFYSDGRVRLATGNAKRFSGFTIDSKAVMADLHEDVSFEMLVAQTSDTNVELTMDGGPFDGHTICCEAIS